MVSAVAPWVRRSTGVLLLVAAALKLQGLGPGPVTAMGLLSATWFQIALIEAEIILGVWLLAGISPVGAWMLACAAFATFAAVSLYQGYVGRASCGCFGQIVVSPWYAFGLDIVFLGALAVFGRPALTPLWREPRAAFVRPLASAGGWLGGGALAFLALAAVAACFFGSLDGALAHFRGERIAIRPGIVDIGTGELGERREVEVAIVNYTAAPVRVVGGTSDCSCITTRDLPLTIQPGESRVLGVIVQMSGRPGIFTRTAMLLTDSQEGRLIRFQLTGRSLPKEEKKW